MSDVDTWADPEPECGCLDMDHCPRCCGKQTACRPCREAEVEYEPD